MKKFIHARKGGFVLIVTMATPELEIFQEFYHRLSETLDPSLAILAYSRDMINFSTKTRIQDQIQRDEKISTLLDSIARKIQFDPSRLYDLINMLEEYENGFHKDLVGEICKSLEESKL